MKARHWGALVLVAALGVAAVAYAKIKPKNIDRSIRTHRIEITNPHIHDNSLLQDYTTAEVQTNGAVAIEAPVAASFTLTESNMGAIAYPTRLRLGLLDDTTTPDTLSCSSVLIVGRDQFGNDRSETLTNIPEITLAGTAEAPPDDDNEDLEGVFTTWVYERVTFVQATCVAGSDAQDTFFITVSRYLGLQRDIGSIEEVISICVADDLMCIGADGIDEVDDTFPGDAYNTVYDWISLNQLDNLGSAPNSFPNIDTGDTITWQVRAPLRY